MDFSSLISQVDEFIAEYRRTRRAEPPDHWDTRLSCSAAPPHADEEEEGGVLAVEMPNPEFPDREEDDQAGQHGGF
jgi:DNA-binding IclR family transcriptional regulator